MALIVHAIMFKARESKGLDIYSVKYPEVIKIDIVTPISPYYKPGAYTVLFKNGIINIVYDVIEAELREEVIE